MSDVTVTDRSINDEVKRLHLLNPDWDWFKCWSQVKKEHPELFPPSRSSKRYTKQCVVCGTEFTRSRSDAQTCSPLCRKRKERRPKRTATAQKGLKRPDKYSCVVCGQEFRAFHEAKTCSVRCRKALSRSPAGYLARLKRLSAAGAPNSVTIEVEVPFPLPAPGAKT